MIADVLQEMIRATWRGQQIHVLSMSFSFEQDHVDHEYPDRDSGFVEATGRKIATYTFQLLFDNGNSLAIEEQYPKAWREFVANMADRSLGTLVHPELGPLKAKPKGQTTNWDPNKRSGVVVEAVFREASDTEDELASLLSKSAEYTAEFEAGFLDGAIPDVTPAPTVPDALKPSLLDSVKQLSGSIAQAKVGIGNVAASVESYANAVDDLAEQIDSLNEPAYAPILESCRSLFDAVINLGQSVKQVARPVTLVFVQRDAPISAVAAKFGNTLEEFLALNPAAGARTSLPAGEPVFVYA